MQGFQAQLSVDASANCFRRADQEADLSGAHVAEQEISRREAIKATRMAFSTGHRGSAKMPRRRKQIR